MSNCIGNFSDIIDKYIGKKFLVLGSGATVNYYKDDILNLIVRDDLVVIGINNMAHIYKPDIHLWTNNNRLLKYGDCISVGSLVVLGCNIKPQNIPGYIDYYNLNYTDSSFGNRFISPYIKNGFIGGSFRQAGNLALFIAALMGASKIYYAGVDGYSKPFNGNQHCYGKGLTDCSIEKAEEKDAIIYKCLKQIKKVVDFEIITPTLFKIFYNAKTLNIGKEYHDKH